MYYLRMKNATFSDTSKLWVYPSENGAWHFLSLSKQHSQTIREIIGKKPRRG